MAPVHFGPIAALFRRRKFRHIRDEPPSRTGPPVTGSSVTSELACATWLFSFAPRPCGSSRRIRGATCSTTGTSEAASCCTSTRRSWPDASTSSCSNGAVATADSGPEHTGAAGRAGRHTMALTPPPRPKRTGQATAPASRATASATCGPNMTASLWSAPGITTRSTSVVASSATLALSALGTTESRSP